MARRPLPEPSRARVTASRAKTAAPCPEPKGDRVAQLVQVIDQCTAAKDIADESGERLLSYLLAMAIQEARTAIRRIPQA